MRAVNLIPAEERRGAGGLAGRSGGVVYVLTGGLAVLVVMGVVYAFAVHSVAQRKGQLASLTAQIGAVDIQTQTLQPYVQFASISEQQEQQATALAQQRFDWPNAMQQLALALPADVTLTSFSATNAAAAGATSPTASGATFTLAGCASTQGEISSVLTSLAAVPGVANVSLTNTVENKKVNGKGSAASAEAAGGGCPDVSFDVLLTYSASYTLPNSKASKGSPSGAQTVSTPSGAKTTIVQTAKQQVTG